MGVAGGATRAALTMHQARRDNMADVSAKDGSQVSPQCLLYENVFGENLKFLSLGRGYGTQISPKGLKKSTR